MLALFSIYFRLYFWSNGFVGEGMQYSKINQMKNYNFPKKSTNIVDLIKKAKSEEKKTKRNTILMATAAVSVLAVSGLVISL